MGNNVDNEENINDYNLLLGLLQVYDLFLNLNQVSNDTILKELQNQDKIYLEKIIEQNEEIIKLLKKIRYNRLPYCIIQFLRFCCKQQNIYKTWQRIQVVKKTICKIVISSSILLVASILIYIFYIVI